MRVVRRASKSKPKAVATSINITLMRPNGHRSNAKIKGDKVTENMLAAAEELLYTLTTGERSTKT